MKNLSYHQFSGEFTSIGNSTDNSSGNSAGNSAKNFPSKPSDNEILNWLQLYRSENIGPITFFKLLEIYSSVANVLENFSEIQQNSSKKIALCSRFEVEKELEELRKFGGDIILHCDSNFPKNLKTIYDCPPLISAKGNFEFLNKEKIAVVGPRNASLNGLITAKKIALAIGQNSFLTTSGMARGIDYAAHEASILSGTVAVLAGGIDNIYPPQNLKLYREISQFGLLISEMHFGFIPKSSSFVQRNRIVSGLSKAVVVIEASLRSGSLITARFANEQGREVFAVPGSPFDPRCQGVNLLIKEGAEIITSLEDFNQELRLMKQVKSVVGSEKKFREIAESETEKFSKEKSLEESCNNLPANFSIESPRKAELDEGTLEKEIFAILGNEQISLEELIESMPKATISKINSAIAHLEILGKVEIIQGKISRIINI